MTTERFKASVQYNDWTGTSATDDADQNGPSEWLKSEGHMEDGEFLLGIKMFAGENPGIHEDPVSVEFILATPGNYENIAAMIEESNAPIEVKSVRIDMNLVDFFALFKRVDIAFSRNGILEGHEYHYED